VRIANGDTSRTVYFVAVDATDLKSRETSLTSLAVWYSIDGGSKTDMTTPTVTHVSNGVWKVAIDEAGMVAVPASRDECEVVIEITATEMAPVTRVFEVFRPKIAEGLTGPTTTDLANAVAPLALRTDVAAVGITKEYLPALNADSKVTTGDTTGAFSAGDIAALADLGANEVTIGETGAGDGIDCQLAFVGMEAEDIPSEVHVFGRYQGNSSHWVAVQAWDFQSGAWEYLHVNSSAYGIPHSTTNAQYRFPLSMRHLDSVNGKTIVRFLHQGGANNAHTGLVLDKVACDFIYHESLSTALANYGAAKTAEIAPEVWGEERAGYTDTGTFGGDCPWPDEPGGDPPRMPGE
jgi:hypothetical protein